MARSKIEWTYAVWNPVTGCTKVSDGCKHCYAEVVAKRFWGERKFTDIICHEDRLEQPMHWRKPRMIFVNSMSDLFHEQVPFEFVDKVMAVIGLCQHDTFQILTKRPERALEYFKRFSENDISAIEEEAFCLNHLIPYDKYGGQFAEPFKGYGWYHDTTYTGDDENDKDTQLIYEGKWPFPNLWMGVSVENQEQADKRIPVLLQIPAAVRWLSCEPLLGPIKLLKYCSSCTGTGYYHDNFRTPCPDCNQTGKYAGKLRAPGYVRPVMGVDWVVAGGESGAGARPMHTDWVESIRDQCEAAKVPFFFKQWGEWLPNGQIGADGFKHAKDDYREHVKLGKTKAGHLLDGKEYRQFPQQFQKL